MFVVKATVETAGRSYQRELKNLEQYELLDLIDDMVDVGGKKIVQVIDTFVTTHAAVEESGNFPKKKPPTVKKPWQKDKKKGKKKHNPLDNFKGKQAKPFKKEHAGISDADAKRIDNLMSKLKGLKMKRASIKGNTPNDKKKRNAVLRQMNALRAKIKSIRGE